MKKFFIASAVISIFMVSGFGLTAVSFVEGQSGLTFQEPPPSPPVDPDPPPPPPPDPFRKQSV